MKGVKKEKRTVWIPSSRLEWKLAYKALLGRYEGIGEELFVLGANELAVRGGRVTGCRIEGKCENQQIKTTVEDGVKNACARLGCDYLGAKWTGQGRDEPPLVLSAEFVGEEENQIVGGVKAGDVLVGVKSNGVHTAGGEMIKKLFAVNDRVLLEAFDKQFFSTAEEELLKPTRPYIEGLRKLFSRDLVKGAAIVDEGGVKGAVQSILPKGCAVALERNSYEIPKLFQVMQTRAGLDDERAYATFTMGVGLVLIVAETDAQKVLETFFDDAIALGKIVNVEEKEE